MNAVQLTALTILANLLADVGLSPGECVVTAGFVARTPDGTLVTHTAHLGTGQVTTTVVTDPAALAGVYDDQVGAGHIVDATAPDTPEGL